ncbi:MAG: hypothetical protein ACE5GO_11540, partial [Anaerolineales bacterium]
MNNTAPWVLLAPASPGSNSLVTGDIDGSGQDDVVGDFGTFGIWAFMNNSTWVQLNATSSGSLVVGNIDEN